jgi:NADH-quinone oxidoreductase subunit L
MYRSYYMTFTGEYRGGEGHHDEHNEDPHAAVAAPVLASSHAVHASDGAAHAHGSALGAHGHDAHGQATAHGHDAGHAAAQDDDHAHGHGHHGGAPHESPWTITLVLSLLAIGSGLTLFLGIPYAWTHRAPILEHWLEPVMVGRVTFAQLPHVLEYVFQGLGVLAATVGWLAARALYKDGKSPAPARLKERFAGVWTVVYNKYYVDELYDLVVIRPALAIGGFFSFFDGKVVDRLVELVGAAARGVANIDDAIDKYLVDGAVNALANATLDSGRALRRIQTGRIQTYLYGALAGGLAIIVLNFIVG